MALSSRQPPEYTYWQEIFYHIDTEHDTMQTGGKPSRKSGVAEESKVRFQNS